MTKTLEESEAILEARIDSTGARKVAIVATIAMFEVLLENGLSNAALIKWRSGLENESKLALDIYMTARLAAMTSIEKGIAGHVAKN